MVQYAHPFTPEFSVSPRAVRFEVHAHRCPQVLPRVLGLFARLDLLPTDLNARQSCGGLWAGFYVDMAPEEAERAAEKLRATVGVDAVVLVHAPAAEDEPPAWRAGSFTGPVCAASRSRPTEPIGA